MKIKFNSPAILLSLLMLISCSQKDHISLSGQWRFQMDPEDIGIKEKWFSKDLENRIILPGSMVENGFGNDVSVATQWTGQVVDKSWYTDEKYEKYRQPGNIKIPFWLQPLKHYVGPAWYQREIEIPEVWRGKPVFLQLERCHWETRLWIDEKEMGVRNSLSTPHSYCIYDLTPGKHVISLRVDNTVKIDVGINAHSVSDHTQTNWNGIIGIISMYVFDPVFIDDLQVYPDVQNKLVKVRVSIKNITDSEIKGNLEIKASGFNSDKNQKLSSQKVDFSFSDQYKTMEINYSMGEDVLLWDEFNPNLYKLAATVIGDNFTNSRSVEFGMREIAANGTQFTINGRKIFLRGTLECCIFPLTGYPPTDVEEWSRIIKAAKSHGLNHFRFHSWCPPKAAFQAADRLGFYFQVECGAWATIGDGRPIDQFIYAESDRILKEYGNHPSFCFLAYGNEPGGANQKEFLGKLIQSWKAKDRRRLYTGASGWPIIPENQFHSDYKPRIHLWGAGLKSRLNAKAPETVTDYRSFVGKYDVPVVSHEIGQWCVYPNFKEIKKYTGVLQAKNFEIFQETLKENHLLDLAEDFLLASGKLQTLCYKEEIESALRTPGFGGFQLLDLHDFPGQGTALVGVLDSFWDSKGYVTPKEFHRFSCETVPLARLEKRIWTSDETFSAKIEIAHFGAKPIEAAKPVWEIIDKNARTLAHGEFRLRTIPIGNGIQLGEISVPLIKIAKAQKLTLYVALEGTEFKNDWDFWVYPQKLEKVKNNEIYITESLDDQTLNILEQGREVLLLPAKGTVKGDKNGNIPAGFTPIFWNTAWTRGQAPHTLGIFCDPAHPLFAEFPTEYHSNWQWWDLVTKSQIMILNDFPAEFRPILPVIDDWFTNRRLGLIFEANVNGGKLLVCSINLKTDLQQRPAARQMLHSIKKYMLSSQFAPELDIQMAVIKSLLK